MQQLVAPARIVQIMRPVLFVTTTLLLVLTTAIQPAYAAPAPVPGEAAPPLPGPLVEHTVRGGLAYIYPNMELVAMKVADNTYVDRPSGSYLILWGPCAQQDSDAMIQLDPSQTWAYFPDGGTCKVAALILPTDGKPHPVL